MIRHLTRTALLRPLIHNPTTTTTHHPSRHVLYRRLATFQVTVPALGDSITEATIADLPKAKGDTVQVDDIIARLETDKVSIDVRSTGSGMISGVRVKQGDTVHVGDVLVEGDDAGAGTGAGGGGGGGQKEAASTDKAAGEPQQAKQQQPQSTAAPTKTQAIDSAHTQQQQQPHQQPQQQSHSTDASQQPHAHQPLIQFRHGRRSTQPNQPIDARKQPTQVPASSLANPHHTTTQPTPTQSQSQSGQPVRGLMPDSYFNVSDFVHWNERALEARQRLPVSYGRKVWSEAEQEAVMMGGAPAYVPKSLQKEKDKSAAAGGGKKK